MISKSSCKCIVFIIFAHCYFIYCSNGEGYRFAMCEFSILLNSWSLERFISRLRLCVTVFQSPTVDEPVYRSYEQLLQIMRELHNEGNETDESPLLTDHNLLNDNFSEDTSEERGVYMEASRPFLPRRIHDIHISGNSDGKSNKHFQLGWENTLE